MWTVYSSGKMVVEGGSVEWSDDDAVKSGSNTEGDVADDQPPERKGHKKNFKTPITTLNMKSDPISTILDKIDAEISSLSRSQSSAGTGSTVIHRPSSRSRSPHKPDDELTRSQLDRPGPMKATHKYNGSYSGSSRGRESPVVNGDTRVNGVVDIYSDMTNDTEDTQRRKGQSDLDSVSAHDVDEKFKQILRKRSGYQEKQPAPSDTDTVKTEDFNRKFQDSLVYSSDDTVEYKSDADESSSDSEKSAKGEESLLWDYFDTVPKSASGFKEDDSASNDSKNRTPQQNGDDRDAKTLIDRLRPKRSNSSPPVYNKQKPTNNHHLSPYNSLRKPIYVSDAESVRTEDFEFRFKDLIVNQMDSETDVTDNDPLHAKVKEILQVTLPSMILQGHISIFDRKNERERSQSENDVRLRDRRKEMINGEAQSSPRDHNNRSSTSTRNSSRRDSLDDERREIQRESERIQREIEMERRAQSFSPRLTKSPTRGMLSITGELPKSTSYNDLSGNEGRNSPRLDHSSSNPSRTSSLLERARTGLFQDRFSPSNEASSPESLGRSRSSSSPERPNSSVNLTNPERNSSLRDKFSTSTPNRASSTSNSPLRDKINTRTGIELDWSSPMHSNLSSPRYTSSQNDLNSPRNGEDKLSVSFQDLPNSPNVSPSKYSDTNKSPTYIDNLASEPRRTTTNYRSNSLDRERPSEGLVSAMKGSRSEVKEAEKKLQLIKAQTDEAKTQLMLTELKRENIVKDVERIEEDLSRKKRQVKNYEDQLRSRLGDIRASDSFIDPDEKLTSLEEENASLKVRLRHMDGLELERDELVRQLDSAKEDLFNEQRQSRNKIEELQEELENLTAQVEEYKAEPGHSQSNTTSLQFQKLEDKIHRLEKEKKDLTQDKNKLVEDLRLISRSPRPDTGRQQLLNRDVEELRNEVATLHNKIGAGQREINNKEDIIGRLKQQNQDLQQMYSKEKGHKDGVMEDHKRSLQTLRKEMDSAMVQMRENMFLEKQKSLEDLRSTLEKDKRDALARAEDKFNHHIKSQSNSIKDKEGELSRMIDLVKKLEEDRRDVETRVKSDSQKQIDDFIKKEKLKLEADFEWRLHKEKEQFQQEFKVNFNGLSKELEEATKVKATLLAQIEKLTTELETQRLQNRQSVHDRMLAVARAKESIRQDMQVDMEKVKSKMKEFSLQDFQQEIDKLQDTIRMQEEEIKQLRGERAEVLKLAKDNQGSERVERTIINEINEECRKNSHVLGISPRKVNMTDFRENGYNSPGRIRTPTTAALMGTSRFEDRNSQANLRACNQELRNHVQELKQEMEHQKNVLIQSQREKSDIVQSVKSQLEREKSYELDKLKEKFVKDHADEINSINKKYIDRDKKYMKLIQDKNDELHKLKENFDKWKKETDSWLLPNGDFDPKQYTKSAPYEYGPRTTAQEQELERLEREIKRLTTNQQPPPRYYNSYVQDDISTTKLVNNLRTKVAELEHENSNLSKYSYSVPDLSDPVYYRRTMRSASPTPQQERIVNILEQRAKEAEFESDTLLDQQQRSRNMMSQKMQEMTKLQTSLTSQTKDLIHLGQAYSKLNNSYRYGKT
ncbi:myosin-15-like isoform X4 [Mytilus californianus]|uniref:myosin-15-like isoform X4 n=1 Tax=Mytilus californianus TaxID=6549 RepID=UPI002246202C|nr:myosin-15-like isoform X4 [Mytilus californianus]